MGTRKIICMGSLFFLSVAIPYERQTSIRVAVPGPFDQTEIEKREDVLVYTTPVLHTAVGVTGMVELKLYVSFKQLQESRRS